MKHFFTILILLLFLNNNKAQQTLYGVAANGGANSTGSIFKGLPFSSATLLNSFPAGISSAGRVYSKLIMANNNKIYGVASNGGTNGLGFIYSFDTITKVINPVYNFDNTNGKTPHGALCQASNGKLYGMTMYGGTNNNGVIYEFDYNTNTYTRKYNFNGTEPFGVESAFTELNGKLYAASFSGGANSEGCIFEYDYTTNTVTVKYDFDDATKNTGKNPKCDLLVVNNELVGTTSIGTNFGGGSLYHFDPSTNALILAHKFNNGSPTLFGNRPMGQMVYSNGAVIGTTRLGGANNLGAIYSVTFAGTSSSISKLDDFYTATGTYPESGLVTNGNGYFYGTTSTGGANNLGTVFFYKTNLNIITALTNTLGANSNVALLDFCTKPNAPTSVSGNTTVCLNSGQNYTISPIYNADSYWLYTPLAWNSVGTNTITTYYTSIPAGMTTVSVSAYNECGYSAPYNLPVNVLALPNVAVNSGSICAGQIFTVTSTGAVNYTNTIKPLTTSSYTNSLSTFTLSPTNGASYTVTGTDANSCSNTVVGTMSVFALPVITVTTNTIACTGKPVVLSASSPSTSNFTWTPGIVSQTLGVTPTTTASITYTITGVNPTTGCAKTQSSSIVVKQTPTVSIFGGSSILCQGQSVNLSASGASTYSWSTNATTSAITVTPNITTTYTVTGTATNGCANTAIKTVTVTTCTGIEQQTDDADLIVYPNPVSNILNIVIPTLSKSQVIIYNSLGKQILIKEISENENSIDLSNYSAGIYFVQLSSKNKFVTKKIIKE